MKVIVEWFILISFIAVTVSIIITMFSNTFSNINKETYKNVKKYSRKKQRDVVYKKNGNRLKLVKNKHCYNPNAKHIYKKTYSSYKEYKKYNRVSK